MHRTGRAAAGLAAVTVAVSGLALAGTTGAFASPRVTDTAPGVTVLNVGITDNSLYLDGPTAFSAGRVKVRLEDARAKGDATFQVVRFATGYTYKDMRADLKIAFANLFAPHGNTKKGLKHLNHAINHSTLYGGLSTHAGHTRHGALLLKDSGTYVIYDDSHNLPRHPHWLHVGAPAGPQALPKVGGKIVAMTNRRFGGSKTLPHKGNIEFVNTSTESPHFLTLIHVAEGTTRKQVRESFQSQSPPTFVRNGEQDLDTLSLNQKMTVHLNLPKGQYVEMCFFPDPKTGMPHAFMGMIHMVHLT